MPNLNFLILKKITHNPKIRTTPSYSTMSDMPLIDSEIRKFLEAYTDAWEKKIDNLEQKIKYDVLLSNPMSEIERNHLKAELKKIVAICEDANRTFCILHSMFQAL